MDLYAEALPVPLEIQRIFHNNLIYCLKISNGILENIKIDKLPQIFYSTKNAYLKNSAAINGKLIINFSLVAAEMQLPPQFTYGLAVVWYCGVLWGENTMTTSTSLSLDSKNIVVNGSKKFPESRWREAILHFLFQNWSNERRVHPEISFGDVILRLNWGKGGPEYYAYGRGSEEPPSLPFGTPGQLIVLEPMQNNVDVAMARFVKDRQIRWLILGFWEWRRGRVYLWKKPQRNQYGIAVERIPASEREANFLLRL